MKKEKIFIQNDDDSTKHENFGKNISSCYINTKEINSKNLKTSNDTVNISNINPFCKNKITLKNFNKYRNKSAVNKKIVKSNPNNNYKEQIEKNIIDNISLQSKNKSLIKENIELQKKLKYENQLRNKDKNNIEILKRTINKLISDNNKNVIINIPNKENKKDYVDLLLSKEFLLDENNKLKENINELINEKNQTSIIKSKLNQKEKEIIDYIIKNEELNNKCESLEKQILILNEKLEKFKNFEEMKILYESLEKNLDIKNEENKKLILNLREKNKIINDLKLMKYDDKLFFLEQKLNEYKIKNEENQITLDKLNIELDDSKKQYELVSKLLKEKQEKLKENMINIEENLSKYTELKEKYDSFSVKKEKIILENNELKLQNSKINKELLEFKNNFIKYKEEVKNLNNQLIVIKDEKNKNEIYFLNQISLLQKEKNALEKQINKLREENYNNNIINNENNDEKFNKKKYDLALYEIKTYNNDIKKLFDLSKKLKNELNKTTKEKNFYSEIISKILNGNYIDNKYLKFIEIVKKNIEIFLDIQNLNQLKYDYSIKLQNYENIIKNMNKKIDTNEIENIYEINKNFYDVDDFSNIAKIQNQLFIINDKLNILDEKQRNILLEMNKY